MGEGGGGALEGALGDLPEMGGAQEGLLELGGEQQALSSTPQSRPNDGIAGHGVAQRGSYESNGSRSSTGATGTGSGDLIQSLPIVHLAGGKWGRERHEERIICYSEGVQLGTVCYIIFLFFFLFEVLVMNQGASSGS